MKILWFTNTVLPAIAIDIGIKPSVNEGWLVGMSNILTRRNPNIQLAIACSQSYAEEIHRGNVESYSYYTYYEENKEKYQYSLSDRLLQIIHDFQPDVIHIMGSEYPHVLSIMEAVEKSKYTDKTVISIQGLISVYGEHYHTMLTEKLRLRDTIHDIYYRSNLKRKAAVYSNRGKYEIQAFKKCKHVIGRTSWDRACAIQLNPTIEYHFNNEVLRPEFYGHLWNKENCIPHSIFFSQTTTPLKGFHTMLQAMKLIKVRYPDVKLFAAGSEMTKRELAKPRWKRSAYGNYIDFLISDANIKDNVYFCESLNAGQMRERYLKSNVFVCSSVIENSPNSVGEAMILGVPVVSVDVGGVSNMMRQNIDGFIYPDSEVYMLAYYVMEIFSNDELARQFSANAKMQAEKTHSREKNADTLMNIYRDIREG